MDSKSSRPGSVSYTHLDVYKRQGENTLVFSANWGYCAYDQVILVPVSDDGEEQETPALEKVNQMIAAIPASVTAADKDAVDAAYAAYQLLSDKEKAEVSGLSRLMICLLYTSTSGIWFGMR